MNIDVSDFKEVYYGDDMLDMFINGANAEDCIIEIDIMIETLKSLREVVERNIGAQ
jgi:hypothetical protein